ncbi:MAG: GYD domain-containing protein [Candidatus Bathyarchaeota archaeon]|nr:GYD domain-containing protein [Candidatus Bathyarchaeota archaeon]
MIFVTLCTVRSGKFEDAVKATRGLPKALPPEVKLKARYSLFGRFDAIYIFEAPDEITTTKFVRWLQDTLDTETFLAVPWAE